MHVYPFVQPPLKTSSAMSVCEFELHKPPLSADPEGGAGGLDPLENHKLYGYLYGISNWTPPPHPPPWKSWTPPLENVGPLLEP